MHLTSLSPYTELSGPYGQEADAVDTVPIFFEKLLSEPTFVQTLTRHVQTGDLMPMDELQRTCKGKRARLNGPYIFSCVQR
jgi:Zn-dependent oligopeptidase